MSNTLFNNFQKVSSKQWKQKIQVDLKGANYNDTLIWQSPEGIHVKPFYHADEFLNLPESSHAKVTTWNILETFYVTNPEKTNIKVLNALANGTEALHFIIPNKNLILDTLLKEIPNNIPLYFSLEFLNEDFTTQLLKKTSNRNSVFINCDIISNLAKSGNWFSSLENDHTAFKNIIKQSGCISINLSLYQNSGANITQQLAYSLAHLNEYFNHLNGTLSASKKEQLNVIFQVSVGTNYFFEIAKLKALRQLYFSLATEYGFNKNCHIVAFPSKRNKTIYDYNTNMLRTTTECMSAILGGANAVNNMAYDAIYHKTNPFGERISRNQLLVLKHESYFDKVNNPADGAYYIETICTQLAEKSLDIFKNIETSGGFLKQLKEGIIQRKIKESALKEEDLFKTKEYILLGTNKHPNPKDKMKNDLELYPFVKTNPRKTLIEPIIEKRLAQKLEQERLNQE